MIDATKPKTTPAAAPTPATADLVPVEGKPQTALAATAPAPIEGFDDWTADDITIPILTLVQAGSEAVKKQLARIGDFQDPASGEVFGPSVEVILLRMRNGAIYFDKKQNAKSFVCRSVNQITSINGDHCNQCPYDAHFNKWVGNQPPKCASTKEFLCVLASSLTDGVPYPVWLSFRKTSMGVAKSLSNKAYSLSKRTKLPLFGHVWKITSREEANPKGDFMNYVVEPSRSLNPEELEVARGFWGMVKDWDIANKALSNEADEHADGNVVEIVKEV